MYICDTCGSLLDSDSIIYYHDNVRDELYLSCPHCRGNVSSYHEEEEEDDDTL